MENKAQPMTGSDIKGYRELSPADIEMMNELKAMSCAFLDKLEVIKGAHDTTPTDFRWLALAKTDMQRACMAACRAVAKPDDDC